MAALCSSLAKFINTSSPTSSFLQTNRFGLRIMSSGRRQAHAEVHRVPADETERIAELTFERYSSTNAKRNGKGVAIVWFRNDLRVLDNEALYRAWVSSHTLLPVYCVDPRNFGATHYFGFPKTGALRAHFLVECLTDLRKNLKKRGLNLLIQHGKPEDILPCLAQSFGAHTVYAHKETCSEEVAVERLVSKSLVQPIDSGKSMSSSSTGKPKLQLVWSATMYHVDDLPFSINNLPDVYTQFRKSVESNCKIRSCIKIPKLLGPPPNIDDWGCVPSIDQLGLESTTVRRGMRFIGGESAGLSRVHEYFWDKDLLKIYKSTRNGMLGPDYSTKFSPWLASGCLTPRFIYEEVKRYEKERLSNNSTYWVLFELIWRDYFRFLSIKYGNSLFHLGGPRKVEKRWSQDRSLFEYWKDGRTGSFALIFGTFEYVSVTKKHEGRYQLIVTSLGYPLIDANMKELLATGFMSNRGRQIVCSFLVRDMGIDWRLGAEWFETCLLDYDPCSNYGNWTYGAGVGNDPREDRYFSIPKQANTYDPEGEYVAYWLPQLQALPKDKRHFPGGSYLEQIVPLKYGNPNRNQGQDLASAVRLNNSRGRHRRF